VIILSIIIAQLLALVFDNFSQLFLVEHAIFKKNKAMAYIKRDQVTLFTRIFIFAVPPLLGILALSQSVFELILILLVTSALGFIITIIHWYLFAKQKKIKLFHSIKIKPALKIVGIIAFFFHLYVPFFLNLVASIYPYQGLWIVQLAPLLTVITAFYVTYYLDPKIAKSIDNEKNWEKSVFELMFYRIMGRFFLFIFSCILLFYYI
jgi:hypothetical protein